MGPAAGWYADPENASRLRYWDGGQWTEQWAPAAPPPPAPQGPPSSASGSGSSVLKIAGGLVLGVVVLIVGCSALLGSAADQVEEEQQEHAISGADYDSVQNGAAQADVEAALGPPESDQDFQYQGIPGSTCIYYNEEGAPLLEGNYFQFCFDGGRLTSKAAY